MPIGVFDQRTGLGEENTTDLKLFELFTLVPTARPLFSHPLDCYEALASPFWPGALHRGKRGMGGESPMPIAEVDSGDGAFSEGLELCVGAGRACTTLKIRKERTRTTYGTGMSRRRADY